MLNLAPRHLVLCCAIASVAAPLAAQIITSLPFGQRNTVMTPLPFGQKGASPFRPLATTTAATAALTGGTVVAQWNMTETSGTVMNDSSGYGNNGKLTNVQLTGAGYIFDGTTSKVVVPNSATLTPGTRDFSFTVQVQTSRIPPQGTDYDLVRKGTGVTSGGEYKLEIVYDRGIGKPKCVVLDALGHSASERGNINVADGLPHTITCTKTGSNLIQQVDSGIPTVATGNLTGAISTTKALALGVKAPTATGLAADWYSGTMINASVSVVLQ